MKKTLLILCALLLTAVGASAQTDVTEQYIQNPSFETPTVSELADEESADSRNSYPITSDELDGWTLTGTGSSGYQVCDIMMAGDDGATALDDSFSVPEAAADGSQWLYVRNAWAGTSNTSSSVLQSVTLPAGNYKVAVDNMCMSSATTYSVALTVGDLASASLPINTATPEAWNTTSVKFTLDEETTLNIGVTISYGTTNAAGLAVLLDNFKLYSIEYQYNITELLANPSFEVDDISTLTYDETRDAYEVDAPEGWTLTGEPGVSDIMTADATDTDNNFGVPGEPSDGIQMLYLRNSWVDNKTVTLLQDLTLPAGDYKITVDTKCVSTTGSTATLVAGDESVALTIHGTENGSEETKNNPFLDGWDTAVLTLTLTETTDVNLGIDIIFNGGNGSFLLDNFQLFSTEDVKAIDFDYDVTWKLANPSFEVDNVAYLSEDETRSYTTDNDPSSYTGGAYTIGNGLTGWTLGGSNAVSDLMTEKCQRTDNNFGAPGTPTDGTQMLYLRNNATTTASVEQTITLPAGDYKLTVDAKCVSSSSSTATLVADGKSKALDVHSTYEELDWDTAVLTFSLDATTDVTVGVDISYSGNGSFLLDNFKLYSVAEIEETISWEMTEAGWGTMILPFAATLEDGLTAYSCSGTEESEDEDGNAITVVSLTEVGQSITANTPYIIKGTAATYSFTGIPTNTVETYTDGILTGTLVDLAVAKGAAFATDGTMYLLQNHEDEDVAFYPIIAATEDADNSKDATLDAYHCYLTLSSSTSGSGVRAFISLPGSDNEETGIVAVEGAEAEANDAIYDLSGRRVAKAVKGVYIQNGKKVLVK